MISAVSLVETDRQNVNDVGVARLSRTRASGVLGGGCILVFEVSTLVHTTLKCLVPLVSISLHVFIHLGSPSDGQNFLSCQL